MKQFLKDMLGTVIYILVVLLICYLIITYICQRTTVNGASMEPTLHYNESLLIDKISYRFKDPERFDIIVFPYRYEVDTNYIKRIIGLPGETVYIDEAGNIYINDELLNESFGKEIIDSERRGLAAEKITLGKDEYFVMGDNRNDSADSRLARVGNIKRKDIIGRAFVRIWPFDSMRLFND